MRTARSMGIRTVAVYAESDSNAPFVADADDGVGLDGVTAIETYLDIAKILAAAERTGADAVHPGYGFLSENAEAARACEAAGLTWVGPSPDAIAAMGDKIAAKQMMSDAGVPTLPSGEPLRNRLSPACKSIRRRWRTRHAHRRVAGRSRRGAGQRSARGGRRLRRRSSVLRALPAVASPRRDSASRRHARQTCCTSSSASAPSSADTKRSSRRPLRRP